MLLQGSLFYCMLVVKWDFTLKMYHSSLLLCLSLGAFLKWGE